ncbi:CRISPR-associated protein Cas4 [Tamilnaduibacter salinus]|nr:CRISPR-associated protein Cas4 [Tamilnaduibacter salinus]
MLFYEPLPVSLLRQYRYCPRVVYFRELLGIPGDEPLWVSQGKQYHEKQRRLSSRRQLSRFGLTHADMAFEKMLRSESIGLQGRPDLVLVGSDELVVVEFKASLRKIKSGHKLQLAAYAMLAELHWQRPCVRGYFLTEDDLKPKQINMGSELRDAVLETRQRIEDLYALQRMPDSSASESQCGHCEYLARCNDRF